MKLPAWVLVNLTKNVSKTNFEIMHTHHLSRFPRSDYILKLNRILEDTSKFKRVNIEEGKDLYHLIHNFCDQFLKPLTSNEYAIKDSFSGTKEISNLILHFI